MCTCFFIFPSQLPLQWATPEWQSWSAHISFRQAGWSGSHTSEHASKHTYAHREFWKTHTHTHAPWDIVWSSCSYICLCDGAASFSCLWISLTDVQVGEADVGYNPCWTWFKKKKIKWIINSHLKAWKCSAYPCNASPHSALSYPKGLERWN